jgi:RNA-directed DNA polymerase
MDPLMGNTKGALKPMKVSTKQQRIAMLAKQSPGMSFTSLNHYLDKEWLTEAYKKLRKGSSPGYDGITVEDYGKELSNHLPDLLNRAKSGKSLAPPVNRVHIPKDHNPTFP